MSFSNTGMFNGKYLPLGQHEQQHKDTRTMVLRSGRKSIHVDKIRITSISQYFKVRLKYEGRVLNMDNKIVPRQYLEQIVEYAKTGQINIDPTNVCNLYLACDYCCINENTEKCQKYFAQNMNIYNLENLITMACTTLLDEICDYISFNYTDSEIKKILLKIPAPFFIELLKNVNFSPLYCGIPAANIDLELFKLLSRYLNMNRISNESILDMVRAINIQDMDFKQIYEIISGCPSLRSLLSFTGMSSNMQLLSDNHTTSEIKYPRLFSRSHQQFSVNTDFREYFPAYSRPRCISVHLSNHTHRYILGISIQYTMIDKIRNYGITDFPNSNTTRIYNFLLEGNEIVNHIQYGHSSKESLLPFVEFYTNHGRHVCFGSPNRYRVIHIEKAPEQNSYFYSFDIEIFPERLKCIWVQYEEHMKMDRKISFIEAQDRRNINECTQVTLLSKISVMKNMPY